MWTNLIKIIKSKSFMNVMIGVVLILLILWNSFDIFPNLNRNSLNIHSLSLSLSLYLFFSLFLTSFSLTFLVHCPSNQMYNRSNNNASSNKCIGHPIDPVAGLPIYWPNSQRVRHVNPYHIDEHKDKVGWKLRGNEPIAVEYEIEEKTESRNSMPVYVIEEVLVSVLSK